MFLEALSVSCKALKLFTLLLSLQNEFLNAKFNPSPSTTGTERPMLATGLAPVKPRFCSQGHTTQRHMTYLRDSTGLLFKDYPGPAHRLPSPTQVPHSHSQVSHQKQVSGNRFIRSLKLPFGTHYILQGGSMTSPERLLCNAVLSFIHDGMVI